MNDREILAALYATVENRRDNPKEGSYTCYLFREGIDKILKKVGEECTETVIAAKNLKAAGEDADREALKSDLVGEVADLFYHLQVMLADVGLSIDDVLCEHEKRNLKVNNKKQFKRFILKKSLRQNLNNTERYNEQI